jgi:N-acetylglucosaminyldiphosphoundecaprenol N-acetyl-beta-D-mannosaminyltransferase
VEGTRGWFGSVNVLAVNISIQHEWFRSFFHNALFTYCDGAGVRMGAWMLGHRIPERIALTDWIDDVCAIAHSLDKSIFLLGAKEQTIARARNVLEARYPGLRIAGSHHGYFSSEDDRSIAEIIAAAHTDILVVGMGMPRQEQWIAEYFEKTGAQIAFDAGAVFDFIAGEKPRCPKWMGDAGFEWLFRLILEPRRLWRRYLIGNPLFLIRVLRARLQSQ